MGNRVYWRNFDSVADEARTSTAKRGDNKEEPRGIFPWQNKEAQSLFAGGPSSAHLNLAVCSKSRGPLSWA